MNKKYIIFIMVIAILIGVALLVLVFSMMGSDKEVTNTPVTKVENFSEPIPEPVVEPVVPVVVAPVVSSTNLVINENTMPVVKIKTNKGDITLELFSEDVPKTVENFITLAKKGFYDGVIFHRVISGFMIQGGDPTGTGTGGPGYRFDDELNSQTPSYKRGYVRGTLAMANAGPNTNGSQFFIMHKDYPLPNAYTIFGRVTKGIEVVDAIAAEAVDSSDRPLEDVVMTKVEVKL